MRSNMTYDASQMPGESDRIVIEAIYPEIDGGRFPVKRVVGDTVGVYADIFRDGHDQLAAAIKYRQRGQQAWQEAPMALLDNDRWGGEFVAEEVGRYEYTVEAWTDAYRTWHRDMQKRLAAGQDVSSEVLEGQRLIESAH